MFVCIDQQVITKKKGRRGLNKDKEIVSNMSVNVAAIN